MAQAVRRSPPTAGIPSSRLGDSMWVSWWTKRSLGKFFSGFLSFPPAKIVIPPFFQTYLIRLGSFRFIRSCDGAFRRGRPASLLFTDLQLKRHQRISSLHTALCQTQVEIYFVGIIFIIIVIVIY